MSALAAAGRPQDQKLIKAGAAYLRENMLDEGEGIAKTDAAGVEADPVRVVQDVGAAKCVHQFSPLGELERRHVDLDFLCAGTLRVVGEGAHAPAVVQQLARDEAPRIAERAGDDVEPGLQHHVRTENA